MEEHIKKVAEATKQWLQPNNMYLKKMIDKTVSEGLFSIEDIKFQIRALKQKIDNGQIEEWAKRANLNPGNNNVRKKILCLHAGNLPLVGFQDALACILSGADYFGKLSKKDPYLLQSYLEKMKEIDLDNSIKYSVNLKDFEGIRADKMYFAGSKKSIDEVKKIARQINAVKENVEWIIRTAKFSIAYIPNDDAANMESLVEAVFRYGGQGCRSVAVVVSPLAFGGLKCPFQDYVELFWMRNPQHKRPNKRLEYQFAYNKAIGREQAWMDDFLIQETEEFPDLDFTLHWVQGGEEKVIELVQKYGDAVQNIYTTGQKIDGLKTELLSKAQTPDLWWQPDGIPVLGIR